MRLDIDAEADAAYLRLTNNPIAQTRQWGEGVLVDIDADGEVIGIEILSLRRFSVIEEAKP